MLINNYVGSLYITYSALIDSGA